MNYQTELMNEILTNKKAQEIIDYVSQIYGQSYVGLWLFQAIGTVLGQVCDLSGQLRYETSPATATMLLSYWEREYNLPNDPTLTTEQRRTRIITSVRSRGACTPERLEAAVSKALGGAPVEIFERTGQITACNDVPSTHDGNGTTTIDSLNGSDDGHGTVTLTAPEMPATTTSLTVVNNTLKRVVDIKDGANLFTVSIQTAVKSLQPAINVIERMKPAHLTYIIRGVTEETVSTDVTVATAMTRAVMYSMDVKTS